MLKEKRRKHGEEPPRRQEKLWRSWLRVEYLLFLLTFAVALALTLSFAVRMWRNGAQQRQEQEETKANQQDYIKYYRHVLNEPASAGDSAGAAVDSSEAADERPPVEDTRMLLNVDIEQFEGQDSLAGEVYATLLEQYPQDVETILSWYEGAKLEEKGEWTTVGKAYPDQAIPERLLKLVLSNEETIPVVAHYPSRLRDVREIDLRDELGREQVPLLLQWDPRWAFTSYGDGMLCYTGCGPTCLSMVALHLKQDSSLTPVAVAEYADQEGYYTDGVGSAWTLMSEGSWHFGLTAEEVSVTEEKMREHLEDGRPLIAAVSAGDFTEQGHFIVLYGYKNGAFLVNDPNSRERSERSWTFEQLEDQIRVIWAFSPTGEG